MRPCPNCKTEWPEDYAGTCTSCGAALSGYKTSNLDNATPGEMDAQLRRAAMKASADDGRIQAMKSQKNAPSGMELPEQAVSTARNYSGEITADILEAFKT